MLKPFINFGLIFFFTVACFQHVIAQNDIASIRKNINVLAKDLDHDLNATKDTLVLKSKQKIHRVYTMADNDGVVDLDVNTFNLKVPLTQLKKGRYVFAVDYLARKIIFQVNILKEPSQPIQRITSLDTDITERTTDVVLPKIDINEATVEVRKRSINKVPQPKKPFNLSDRAGDRQNMQTHKEAKEAKRLEILERRKLAAKRKSSSGTDK